MMTCMSVSLSDPEIFYKKLVMACEKSITIIIIIIIIIILSL
jgi:hypothetical protein